MPLLGSVQTLDYNRRSMAIIQQVPTAQRQQLARLINPAAAGDALAAYYALSHPAGKVQLWSYAPGEGSPTGFLVQARTGFDLFRPLIIPHVAQAAALHSLLGTALVPGHPVLIMLPASQREGLEAVLDLTDARSYEMLRLEPRRLEPVINVLIQSATTPDGLPRFEIRSGDSVAVTAGVNWIGETFAEVYLHSASAEIAAGKVRSVLSAIAGHLLHERRVALLQVASDQEALRSVAITLGFRATGDRLLHAQAVLRGDQAHGPHD